MNTSNLTARDSVYKHRIQCYIVPNYSYFLGQTGNDMKNQSVIGKIVKRIRGYGRGKVFAQKDFLDLGESETVRKSLIRLSQKGEIRRLLRGVYCYPEQSSILKGPAPVDSDSVAQVIARTHGWTILPSGETALNLLGLSTQVPSVWEYLSDGPSKEYRWEGGRIRFRRRANRETTILSPKTALIVQALKTLGEKNVTKDVIGILKSGLSKTEITRSMKEAQFATGWVFETIKMIAAETKDIHE